MEIEKINTEELKSDGLDEEFIEIYINNSLPYKMLDKLSNEQLENPKIKSKILNSIKDLADSRCRNAYNQYMYGPYGGEDVAAWELSKAEQLQRVYEETPTVIQKKYKIDIFEMICKEINVEEKKDVVEKKLNLIDKIENSRELIIQNMEQNYDILEKYKTFFESDKEELKYIEYDIVFSLLRPININTINESISHYEKELKKIETNISNLKNENHQLRESNELLEKTKLFFWQINKKKDIRNKINENIVVIDKNSHEVNEEENKIKVFENNIITTKKLKRDVQNTIPKENLFVNMTKLFSDNLIYDLVDENECSLLANTREQIKNIINRQLDYVLTQKDDLIFKKNMYEKVMEHREKESKKIVTQ